MKADKIKSANMLFDTIGSIDDRLIQEAQSAPVRKAVQSRRKSFTAIIALAATLALTICILGATIISKLVEDLHSALTDNKYDGDDTISTPDTSTDLSHSLINAENNAIVVTNAEDIDFFDGNTSIVWKQKGENDYRMLTISSTYDSVRLKAELQKPTQQIAPEDTESPECEVWITFGDGTVVSPYLKVSAGNIGYAELFEYSPEIEPSAEFTALINDLISD